jgi:hypothetical protein
VIARHAYAAFGIGLLTLVACQDSTDPSEIAAPRFAAADERQHTVVVNPRAPGNGVVTTIQDGIDVVADGGTVLVTPGIYDEQLTIGKGVAIDAIGGGTVIVEPIRPRALSGLEAAISVTTAAPVVIRNITLKHENARGLNALFIPADVTLEGVTFLGRWPFPPPIFNNGVSVVNNAARSGGRAHLVIRDSRFSVDGNAVSLGGDIDALIERTEFLHQSSNAGCVFVSPTGQGVTVPAGAQTNVDIRDNFFDDCGANPSDGSKGVAPIVVLGTLGAATTGTVNIVGNTLRSSVRTSASCNTTGITYEFFTGRIERNSLIDVVHDCATPSGRSLPGAIFVGSRVAGMRAASVSVRFNDIAGNAHAGLRVGSNQTSAMDATCNWWGDVSGPSGIASGSGDRILLEVGATAPVFTPFATAPLARAEATGCGGGL